jgi:peptidoglycan/xylan/chitin deacetylase (PgdA/CDA1 family)
MFSGKRELLARGLYRSGAPFLFSRLPAQDLLLVLNYHRIGDRDADLFDPDIFSATGDEFNEQVAFLKKQGWLVTLEEAQAFVDGTQKERTPRYRVLITFDDGYLDNYQIAFPVLRSHKAQAVFFLVTGIVGSGHVPWWDQIAFLVKTARQRKFTLRYPAELAIDLDQNGWLASLRDILALYKTPANTDGERFLGELAENIKADAELPTEQRRFLDWEEARKMLAGGMAVGSHTHSHPVLNQLNAEQQRDELTRSRALLQDKLNIKADSIAYPVGVTSSFSPLTEAIAEECGYRTAFSFHGGINRPTQTAAYDVKRVAVSGESQLRFRMRAINCRVTGEYWP